MATTPAFAGASLGSASLATNSSGQVVSQLRYKPYGEVRWQSGAMPTNRRFTGHRSEDGFGLIDMRARYYDPLIGRFISADSIVQAPGDPQTLNRYAYTRNNPLKYVDPSGHCFIFAGIDTVACIGLWMLIVGGGTAAAVGAAYTPEGQKLARNAEKSFYSLAVAVDDVVQSAKVNVAFSAATTFARIQPSHLAIRNLTPDEEKHIRRIEEAETFSDDHPDIEAEVAKRLQEEKPQPGKDHINEAQEKIKQLDRSIGTLKRALRHLNESDKQRVEEAIEKAKEIIDTLNRRLSPLVQETKNR